MRYYPVETKIEPAKILVKAVVWEKQAITHWFLFDTGSDVVSIPKDILIQIGAKKLKDVKVKGAIGEAPGELYSANIECGGIKLEGVEVYSGEDYLIGMNFIIRANIGFFWVQSLKVG